MVDVQTTTAIAAIGYPLVQKILGPSSEHLGGQLKLFTEKSIDNLKSIFIKAEKKIPEEFEQKGSVPHQILKDVVFNGSFCTDEVTQDYYAGLLASSKTENERDNRGLPFTQLLNRLSNYQIKFHYFIFLILKKNFLKSYPFNFDDEIPTFYLYVSLKDFIKVMSLNENETKDVETIALHTIKGLHQEGLIKEYFLSKDLKKELTKKPLVTKEKDWLINFYNEPGIVLSSSSKGMEFFSWAHGFGTKPIHYYMDEAFNVEDPLDITSNLTFTVFHPSLFILLNKR